MAYLYRGITVGELIAKLTEFDRDSYVVVRAFDHSYDHRIDANIEYAEYTDGVLCEADSRYQDGAFEVVVIS